ncbi:hypothetical protein [Amycolatopsis lurida]|uniref:hypothetical protein n=1 Tax=Amycolatopsis lurida TaxID=31959 RepID=UPI0019D70120|nr:hypothetical protein [Amycolatopsis lurida]
MDYVFFGFDEPAGLSGRAGRVGSVVYDATTSVPSFVETPGSGWVEVMEGGTEQPSNVSVPFPDDAPARYGLDDLVHLAPPSAVGHGRSGSEFFLHPDDGPRLRRTRALSETAAGVPVGEAVIWSEADRGSAGAEVLAGLERAERARLDRPVVLGEPDFSGVREAVLAQLVLVGERRDDWESWVETAYPDDALRRLERTLETVHDAQRAMEIEVQAVRIGAPMDEVDAVSEISYEYEGERRVSDVTAEGSRTPVNLTNQNIPAGPVTVGLGLKDPGVSSMGRMRSTSDVSESSEVRERGAVSLSDHVVIHRVLVRPRPGRLLHRNRPGEVREVPVPMRLGWPRHDVGTGPSGRMVPLAYPQAPRTDHERGVLQEAFENGGGTPGEFDVAIHHDEAGHGGDVRGHDARVEVRRDGTVWPLPDSATPTEGAIVLGSSGRVDEVVSGHAAGAGLLAAGRVRPSGIRDGGRPGHAEVTPAPLPAGGPALAQVTSGASRSLAEQQAVAAYDRVAEGLSQLAVPRSELMAMVAEFTALAGDGRLEHHALPDGTREQLISLDRSLAAFSGSAVKERVRAFVNDALLAACLVPTRERPRRPKRSDGGVEVDRRAIRPITSARLTQLLDDLSRHIGRAEDPFAVAHSPMYGVDVSTAAALPVRLTALGLVNLAAPARAALAGEPLMTALLDNPAALTEALFASVGHEEQYFLNTCVAASVDIGVRSRVPSLAGLLHVGRAVADNTEGDLGKVRPESRTRPDRTFGRTREEMVRKRVTDARAEFTAIEQRALQLVAADQADRAVRREWRALSERWGRSMQKLAAANLRSGRVPVLTRKVVRGDWWTSLALTAPLVVDRGRRRFTGLDQASYAGKFQAHLALEPDGTLFGADELIDDRQPGVVLPQVLRTPEQRIAFWRQVAADGGTVVGTPDHRVQLQAVTVDGRPVFVMNNPMNSYPALLTPEEFAGWAGSWEAKVSATFFPRRGGEASAAGEDNGPASDEFTAPEMEASRSGEHADASFADAEQVQDSRAAGGAGSRSAGVDIKRRAVRELSRAGWTSMQPTVSYWAAVDIVAHAMLVHTEPEKVAGLARRLAAPAPSGADDAGMGTSSDVPDASAQSHGEPMVVAQASAAVESQVAAVGAAGDRPAHDRASSSASGKGDGTPQGIPGELYRSNNMGVASQVSRTEGVDQAVAKVVSLVSKIPEPSEIATVQHELGDNIGSFLGEGRVLEVGGELVRVKAKFRWPARTTGNGTGPAKSMTGKTADSAKAQTSTQRSPKTQWIVFLPMVPGLFATGKITVPTAAASSREHSHTLGKTVQTSVSLPEQPSNSAGGYLGMRSVRVPVSLEINRLDRRGADTGPKILLGAGKPAAAPIAVTLSVPAGLRQEGKQIALPPALPPMATEGTAVRAVVAGRHRGKLIALKPGAKRGIFEQVIDKVGRLGKESREYLREFLTIGLEARLPKMAVTPEQAEAGQGWITSEALYRGGNPAKRILSSRSQKVQMRAVAREIAYLEAIDDAQFREHATETGSTSSSSTSGRDFDAALAGGPGLDVGGLSVGAGPAMSGGYGRSRTSTHAAESAKSVTRSYKGTVLRYRVVYDLEVRQLGRGEPITFAKAVNAVQWAKADDARQVGLDPAAQRVEPDAAEHIEESVGAAAGSAALRLGEVSGLLSSILRDSAKSLPGPARKRWAWRDAGLVTSFDDPKLRKGLTGKLERQLGRGEAIDDAVSPERLALRAADLAMERPLVLDLEPEPGRAHDYHVAFRIDARLLGQLEDLGPAPAGTSEAKFADSESGGTSTSRLWAVAGGLRYRVYTALAGGMGLVTGTNKIEKAKSATAGRGQGAEVTAGGVLGRELDESGAVKPEPVHRYAAKVELTVSGSSWSRYNELVRGLTVGRRGEHTPKAEPLPIVDTASQADGRPPGTVILDVIVEQHPSEALPVPLRIAVANETRLPVQPLNGSSQLREGASQVLDGIRVLTAHGLGHVRDAVRDVLKGASGDDIWKFEDGDNSALIDQAISMDSMRIDLRAFSRPTRIDGLRWKRRRADTTAAVAVSYRLLDPQVIDKLWEQPEHAVTGTSETSAEADSTWTQSNEVEPAALIVSDGALHSSGISAHAANLTVAELGMWKTSSGTKSARKTKISTTRSLTGEPRRLYLIEATLEATVAAETFRQGNLDRWLFRRPRPGRQAAKRLELPKAVRVVVTEKQLHEIRIRQAEVDALRAARPAAVPAPVGDFDGSRAVPDGYALGGANWADGVTESIDLSDRLELLHRQLVRRLGQKKADQILPLSSRLGAEHDNYRAAERFLSRLEGPLADLANGGASTSIRAEDSRLTGETYELVVGAQLLGSPEAVGIAHGELAKVSAASAEEKSGRNVKRVLAELMTLSNAAVKFGPESEHGSSGGEAGAHGAPYGLLGYGAVHIVEWLSQFRNRMRKQTSEYVQSEVVSGALAERRAEVLFDVRIERHGERIAAAPDTRTVLTLSPVEDRDAGGGHRSAGVVERRPHTEADDAPTHRWHEAPGAEQLPEDPARYRVIGFDGKVEALVDAAASALEQATGKKPDAAARAMLREHLRPSRLGALAGPRSRTGTELELPAELGARLVVHSRIEGPGALTSVSARIKLDGSTSSARETEEQRGSGSANVVASLPLVGGGVPQAPGHESVEEGRQLFGNLGDFSLPVEVHGAAAGEDEYGTVRKSAGGSLPEPGTKPSPDPITSSWSYPTQFRFVAEPTTKSSRRKPAVVDVDFAQGYHIRRADRSDRLPVSLVRRATELAQRDREWTAARGGARAGSRPGSANAAERRAAGKWWLAKQRYETALETAQNDPVLTGGRPAARIELPSGMPRLPSAQRAELFRLVRHLLDERERNRTPRVRYRVLGDPATASRRMSLVTDEWDALLRLAQAPTPMNRRLGRVELGLAGTPHLVATPGLPVVEIWIDDERDKREGRSTDPEGPVAEGSRREGKQIAPGGLDTVWEEGEDPPSADQNADMENDETFLDAAPQTEQRRASQAGLAELAAVPRVGDDMGPGSLSSGVGTASPTGPANAEFARPHIYVVDDTQPRLAEPGRRADLKRLADALKASVRSQRAVGLPAPRVAISGPVRDTRIVAALLQGELGNDPGQPLPVIVTDPGPKGRVIVMISMPDAPKGAQHAPNAHSVGGVSFDSGLASERAWWQRVHDALPPPAGREKTFFVYVTGHKGKFLVGGALIDGVTLARYVRNSSAFRQHAANPSVSVWLVGADPAHPDESTRAAKEFAEALRGDGPYRRVSAATERLELDDAGYTVLENDGLFEDVAEIRPDDVKWKQLSGVDRRRFGMGFAHSAILTREEASTLRLTNDHSLRAVNETYTDATGKEFSKTSIQAWANQTDGLRTRPVEIFLRVIGDKFFVPLTDGSVWHLSPEVSAELVAKASAFRELTAGLTRPSLLVFSKTSSSKAATVSDANRRFLAKLRAVSGPWQTYDYTGRYSIIDGRPILSVPGGSEFVEGPPPALAEVRHEASDGVFGFPVPGTLRHPAGERAALRVFIDAVREGTADLGGPWAPKKPLIVSVDSPDGTFARIATQTGHVLELDGRQLGRMLLADPGFRQRLEADPQRPVVLVARDGSTLGNFGGLGFDFAGALRAEGFFTDVYAPNGAARIDRNRIHTSEHTEFLPVSGLRAGDVRTEVLRNGDGEPVALFVRYAGDDDAFHLAKEWARNVTADRLRTYKVGGGSAAAVADSPWGDQMPVFLFAGVSDQGYEVIRQDGVMEHLTPAELAWIVRGDPVLRKMLGRGDGRPSDRALVFAALKGNARGGREFTQALLRGGYSRLIHHTRGDIKLSRGGRITTRDAFETEAAPLPGPDDVVTYAMANERLGTHGQFLPLSENDATDMFLPAFLDSATRQQYYFRGEEKPAADNSNVECFVPVLASWAGSALPVWYIDGHGDNGGWLSFGLKTDLPLHIGDTVKLDGAAGARIIAGTEVYRQAGVDPAASIALVQCSTTAIPTGESGVPVAAAPAANLLKAEWHRLVGPARVFGATHDVEVTNRTALRRVVDGGKFTEALPDGAAVPDVPLADLAASRIEAVEVGFPSKSKSLPGSEVAAVRRVARQVARAAAWRRRNDVELPEVTIRGFGRPGLLGGEKAAEKTGRKRADVVAAMFWDELVAEALQLSRLGLDLRADHVAVRVSGAQAPEGVGPSARIDVRLVEHDLGERAVRQVIDDYMSTDAVRKLNKAFTLLVPDAVGESAGPSGEADPVVAPHTRVTGRGGAERSGSGVETDRADADVPMVDAPEFDSELDAEGKSDPEYAAPASADVPGLIGQLSDEIAQMERHLAVLPASFAPELRDRIKVWSAYAKWLSGRHLSEQDLAGLSKRLVDARNLTGRLRDLRLQQVGRDYESAVPLVEEDL